jgi:hypothetical protein
MKVWINLISTKLAQQHKILIQKSASFGRGHSHTQSGLAPPRSSHTTQMAIADLNAAQAHTYLRTARKDK